LPVITDELVMTDRRREHAPADQLEGELDRHEEGTVCSRAGAAGPSIIPACSYPAPSPRREGRSLDTRTSPVTPALRIDNLRKTYDNGVQALKGVSLEVAPGDFFALLGPNGAGKSTLIGIVSSLVNLSEGQVQVFGTDLVS